MCGPTSQEKAIAAGQQTLFNTMSTEAGQVFGENSAVYKSLIAAFEPILAAGPNQQGFSGPELAALDTQASSGVAGNYQDAARAVRESGAGAGGGDVSIPSGEQAQLEGEVADRAAGTESTLQNQITEANYATGRQDFAGAVTGLENAGSVFTPAISLGGAAVGAGSAAFKSAEGIQAAKDEWVGALGGLAGGALSKLGGSGGSPSSGGSGYQGYHTSEYQGPGGTYSGSGGTGGYGGSPQGSGPGGGGGYSGP